MHYRTARECLGDAYDEIAHELQDEFMYAFAESPTWSDGLNLGMERMLSRMADRPDEAQLLFVETLCGDRELMRRREAARRRMIRLLSAEHRRRDDSEPPSIQYEMLLGACFQLISAHACEGGIEELPELAPELAELASVFEPVAA
jgi:hypothetical protein